jgi:pilin isopeptide linkage protein
LDLIAHKVLEGKALQSGDFQFALTAKNGAPMPHGAVTGTLTVHNDARGMVEFGTITYTAAGTYQYTVEEVNDQLGGITYDPTVYTVTVTVVDNHWGALVATYTVSSPEGGTALHFRNVYHADDATVSDIVANKVLTDLTGGLSQNVTVNAGDFTFRLEGQEGAPMPAGAEGQTYTFKNGANGAVKIPAITYTQVGTYVYTLREVAGSAEGITYSDVVYTITVTVEDNNEGRLVATTAYAQGQTAVTEMTFVNTFKAPDATLVLAGKKILSGGRDLQENEFSFHLKGEGVDETVKNDAEGNFLFSTLTYDTVGTYTYEITEVKGSDTQVTYDETKYTVTVTVTYTNGVMKAVATVDGEPVDAYSFTNIFTPKDLTVELAIEKVLKGTSGTNLTPAGFQFQMIGTDQVSTSDAQGDAKFTVTYTAADIGKTYTYQFSEIKGNLAGVIYDESVQQLKVTITQDSVTGELEATVEGQVVFTNVYEQPPKTADDFNLNGWLLMMSVSAVCLMAVIVIGKKKLAV